MADAMGLGSERKSRILRACERCWLEVGPHGVVNSADCSGFVQSVMARLNIPVIDGQANDIHDAVAAGPPGWSIIGRGAAAASIAGRLANEGRFVLAVWKNPVANHHGHVAIIVADMSSSLRSQKIEQNIMAYWGQHGGTGKTFTKLTASFGAGKLPAVLYTSYQGAV